MGEDFRSWIPELHERRPPDPYSLGAPFVLGQQNFISAYRTPGTSMLFTNGTLPVYASSGLPHSQLGRPNEPHGWFYCWPSIQQAFMPATPTVLKEKLSTCSFQNPKETLIPCVDPDSKQKRLLVSNPSGDQTSFVFNSGLANPLQCPTSWDQQGAYYVNGNDRGTNRGFQNPSGPILTDELKASDESGAESEMHEDTEELNALLYSDDESDYTEDDEVTSTGHSPSTMTVHDKLNWFEAREEEVASSCGITKKRKLFDGGYDDVPSVLDTASSKKRNRSAELEDDAESCCAFNRSSGSRELDSLSCNKKMKKDKIRETVSILQDIIPGVKGKDAMVVIDEAIHYLKSLKLKARAFGLQSL
ncbi:putative transcription factor bHLH family [Rosa chinensis]|uniref:Putative transcription factor bHLH family n=1 Tax=Rosa chinensis TaxID=74649 RepID=A0A2P6PH93_ROSCH|nr:transcription factor bHLH143 [Rosa chinensis]PRQ21287.1 putative transcription factor bHLH family [Rosa chinensis]